MIFYESEGALFRNEKFGRPWEIYLPSGEWQHYTDPQDNLFVSAKVIDEQRAKEIGADIDTIVKKKDKTELTLQHGGEPGPEDPHKSGSPQTVHGKKTGISKEESTAREEAQRSAPSEVRLVTQKVRTAAEKDVHSITQDYLKKNNLLGHKLEPEELADLAGHLGQNIPESTMSALQTRCVIGNCTVTGERYTLNLYEDDHVSTYLLRWGPNEEAEWHDHGDGRDGAKVGVYVHGDERVENDILLPTGKTFRQVLEPGKKYALGAPYIHRVADHDNRDESWTIHAYSGNEGGLAKMNFYKFDRGGNIVTDADGKPTKISTWDNPRFAEEKSENQLTLQHMGPGFHPSGSPQSVHGIRGGEERFLQLRRRLGVSRARAEIDRINLTEGLGPQPATPGSVKPGTGQQEFGFRAEETKHKEEVAKKLQSKVKTKAEKMKTRWGDWTTGSLDGEGWKEDSSGNLTYNFEVGEGRIFEAEMSRYDSASPIPDSIIDPILADDPDVAANYTLYFYDEGGSTATTGGGNAMEAVRKVARGVADVLEHERPLTVDFSGSGGGRKKVYRFLTVRAKDIFPGYVGVTDVSESGGQFQIVRQDVVDAVMANDAAREGLEDSDYLVHNYKIPKKEPRVKGTSDRPLFDDKELTDEFFEEVLKGLLKKEALDRISKEK